MVNPLVRTRAGLAYYPYGGDGLCRFHPQWPFTVDGIRYTPPLRARPMFEFLNHTPLDTAVFHATHPLTDDEPDHATPRTDETA